MKLFSLSKRECCKLQDLRQKLSRAKIFASQQAKQRRTLARFLERGGKEKLVLKGFKMPKIVRWSWFCYHEFFFMKLLLRISNGFVIIWQRIGCPRPEQKYCCRKCHRKKSETTWILSDTLWPINFSIETKPIQNCQFFQKENFEKSLTNKLLKNCEIFAQNSSFIFRVP